MLVPSPHARAVALSVCPQQKLRTWPRKALPRLRHDIVQTSSSSLLRLQVSPFFFVARIVTFGGPQRLAAMPALRFLRASLRQRQAVEAKADQLQLSIPTDTSPSCVSPYFDIFVVTLPPLNDAARLSHVK